MILNIKQRFVVVLIYISLILGLGFYLNNSWQFVIDTNNNLNSVLIATALALVLSSYITEPFFSKPIDVITRWTAIFLFLIGLNSKNCFLLYNYWIIASISFTVIALLLILAHGFNKFEKQQRIAVDVLCKISRPEYVFGALYFDIVVSYFQNYPIHFPLLIAFGALLIINKPINQFVLWLSKLFRFAYSNIDTGKVIGQVIGHESSDFYKVEVSGDMLSNYPSFKGKIVTLESDKNGLIGIVVNEKFLLGKKWLYVISLRDENKSLITINLTSFLPLANEKTIFSRTNAVSLLIKDELPEETKLKIENNEIYKNYENLIGYVWSGSTLNQIKFHSLFSEEFLKDKGIGEGSILQAKIANQEVLYQIIDARTNEESLEFKDTHGFTIGTAQKLGRYSFESNELNTVKWLPEIYCPLFLLNPSDVEYQPNNFIGKLPKTNYGIPLKLPNELITHNTAILGILGIGKSCLTFELIKKVVDLTNTKVVCIDITGQYYSDLVKYIDSGINEIDYASIDAIINPTYKTINKDIEEGGNHKLFKEIVYKRLESLFDIIEERVLIVNPQTFNVSYQVGEVKNKKVGPGANDWAEVASMRDLSVAEITRIISEVSLDLCKSKGITDEARLLLVFEEAHSLVPEWNSVSNDGDKNATNGTAKVILQGRKYGLGSFVITQRTANISKSILNQCNTIFAMRIFDDTGKHFLENYIGSEYSNLLPTLEERHSIVIGKSMKLKQPVILELNDKNAITIPPQVL
jgi:hypothetical protein